MSRASQFSPTRIMRAARCFGKACTRQWKADLTPIPLPATSIAEMERMIVSANGASDTALISLPDPFFASQRQRIAQSAIQARLPSMFGEPDYTKAGGL